MATNLGMCGLECSLVLDNGWDRHHLGSSEKNREPSIPGSVPGIPTNLHMRRGEMTRYT